MRKHGVDSPPPPLWTCLQKVGFFTPSRGYKLNIISLNVFFYYISFRFSPDTEDKVARYSIWGVVVTEVEVDILTGEMYIVRADIIEDAGLSTSPQVQIPNSLPL